MKFIFLNGPPLSGKDHAATLLSQKFESVVPVKFAAPLYDSIPRLFGIETAHWDEMYLHEKETPTTALQGMSPRDAMIWLSEDVMKPRFGEDVFGRSMVTRLVSLQKMGMIDHSSILVASDSGFGEEAVPVIEHMGSENVLRVEISSPGCSFSGDSRSYWHIEGIPYHMVTNHKDDAFGLHLEEIVRNL